MVSLKKVFLFVLFVHFFKEGDPELCFSLIGPTTKEGQTRFDIETITAFDKRKWVEALGAVLEFERMKSFS